MGRIKDIRGLRQGRSDTWGSHGIGYSDTRVGVFFRVMVEKYLLGFFREMLLGDEEMVELGVLYSHHQLLFEAGCYNLYLYLYETEVDFFLCKKFRRRGRYKLHRNLRKKVVRRSLRRPKKLYGRPKVSSSGGRFRGRVSRRFLGGYVRGGKWLSRPSQLRLLRCYIYLYYQMVIRRDLYSYFGIKVNVKFVFLKRVTLTADVLCEYMLRRLRRGEMARDVFYDVSKSLYNPASGRFRIPKLTGFKLEGNGMFVRKHQRQSQKYLYKRGALSLTSFKDVVDFARRDVCLLTAKCGIKVWLARGKANTHKQLDVYGRYKSLRCCE